MRQQLPLTGRHLPDIQQADAEPVGFDPPTTPEASRGPTYAKRLTKSFGEQVFDVIEQEPDRLREVGGIGPKRSARIVAGWAEQKVIRECATSAVPARKRSICLRAFDRCKYHSNQYFWLSQQHCRRADLRAEPTAVPQEHRLVDRHLEKNQRSDVGLGSVDPQQVAALLRYLQNRARSQ